MKEAGLNNDFIVEHKPYVFAKPWHKEFPAMVIISITNVCNLKCPHCYYSKFIKLPGYRPNMLAWDLWEKICEEAGRWPGVIMNFGTDGEPLVHPRLLDMLRLARRKRIYPVNITTNGLLMDEEFNSAVVGERLVDIMNISIDAFTPETYVRVRGGDYGKLTRNINNLITQRNNAKSPLKIQVNFIDQPDTRSELTMFKRYWESRVDLVLTRIYYDATSVTGETGPNITGKQDMFEKVERWPCQQLWRRINIADDGIVRFCVDDWFNKTKLGDLNTQSIAQIWRGADYNRLRHLHVTGQFGNVPYCAKCTEWQGMKWDYDYFLTLEKLIGKKFV